MIIKYLEGSGLRAWALWSVYLSNETSKRKCKTPLNPKFPEPKS